MAIACSCGDILYPEEPVGRWMVYAKSHLDLQNNGPERLLNCVMVSSCGTSEITCGTCETSYAVEWTLLFDSEIDDLGKKARYAMSEPVPFRACPICATKWRKVKDHWLPKTIDALKPCACCAEKLRSCGYGQNVYADLSSAKVLEVAKLFLRLMDAGTASYDNERGVVLFRVKDEDVEEEVMGEIARRCREDDGFLDAAHSLMNGSLIYIQKMRSAMGGDFVSDLLHADLGAEEGNSAT